MRTFYLAVFFCTVNLLACKTHSDKTDDNPGTSDTVAKAEPDQAFETPLLKTIKDKQDYISSHHICQIFCYAKPLGSIKDTFSMDEIQNFDRQGRLINSFAVNGSNTDTFWRQTFLYNTNGVLKRINMKLENGQTSDEYFIYTKDGHLLSSFLMASTSPAIDTSWFKYSADTIYKFGIDEGQTRPYPDLEIVNSRGLTVKSIDHLPPGSTPPYEVSQETYTDTCPIPKREVVNRESSVRERIFKLHYY